MLIDYTYFFEDLEIGQLSQQAVQDKLNMYITKYEPKFLAGVLGYAAYKQMKADLLLTTIPQRWMDLLYGAEFTYNGQLQIWEGLIRLPGMDITALVGANQIDIVVGRARDAYDPTSSSPGVSVTTTIIPANLVGNSFVFIQRGYGPLRADEFSVSGNVLTLLGGLVFTQGDTYFYYGNTTELEGSDSDSDLKESPIANFIYYWYQRSQVTNTGGVGESKTQTENAIPVSPGEKMASAWNKMVEMNVQMYRFLNANKDTYPEWYDWALVDDSNINFLRPINTFNI